MKKNLFGMIGMLGLMMVAVASAQAQQGSRIMADIPFDFSAGEKKLPAGTYTVRQISQNIVLIEGADGKTRAAVQAPRSVVADSGKVREKLVFRQYEDHYFLTQVWSARNSGGRELNQSDAERRLSKELKATRNTLKPTAVEIVAAAK